MSKLTLVSTENPPAGEGDCDKHNVTDGGKFQRLANTVRRSGPAYGSSRPAPEPD